MDLNLTGELWGMPISFIGQMTEESSIEIIDWLPSIVSIVVVIIGGFITYSSTIRIEEQRRQYELKKGVYFETLGMLADAIKIQKKMDNFFGRVDELKVKTPEEQKKEMDELMQEIYFYIDILSFQKLKLRICASNEVNYAFDSVLKDYENHKDSNSFFTAVNLHLIPAIKDDMVRAKPNHWWEFWK